MFTIIEKRFLAPDIYFFKILAPRVAAAAKPGQFVIVQQGERGERIPLTICDFDTRQGSISLVIQVVGASSAKLCALPEGSAIDHLAGPLGNASDFMQESPEALAGRRFLFIAGGLGTAPVYPQAKYLHACGACVEIIMGARTRELVILEKEMQEVCDRLHVCTDDGSYGFKGLVTAKLQEILDSSRPFDQAVAIGPLIMMKFVSLTAKPYRLPLTVSLNTLMVDGTGMCGSCRVTVGGKTRFACVDGPEFDAYQVDFDEALRRSTLYKEQEVRAAEQCRAIAAFNRKHRVPVREQPPQVRIHNFEEVSLGYDAEEARREASRCLNCKNPPCVKACPVQIDIPAFIHQVSMGNIAEAGRIIARDSSLPAVCGRVCPQETQCEGTCVMGIKAQPISIGKLERYVADHAPEQTPSLAKPIGKSVAVVGSGPAGLSCAGDLAKAGVKVHIFESLHVPGGVLAYGIPEFRLPKKKVLAREIERVRALGVTISCDVVVGQTVTIDDLLEKEGFDAVFIASGAGLPKFMNIPGENLNGVISANEFLTRSNLMSAYDAQYDTPLYVGSRVVVIGGGNVAMDAARTALRLGAHVEVVYRRTEREMPARVEEVNHAREEGVVFRFLCNPVEILSDARGWVNAVRCIRMQLGEPDASGRRRPIAIPGSEFEEACDGVIVALGTDPNPRLALSTRGIALNAKNCIKADEQGATTRKKVYAGGDAVSGAATVILAMGTGRGAAAAILAALQS